MVFQLFHNEVVPGPISTQDLLVGVSSCWAMMVTFVASFDVLCSCDLACFKCFIWKLLIPRDIVTFSGATDENVVSFAVLTAGVSCHILSDP